MSSEAHQKVTANHLRRNAYLYVRQSTMRQVFENTESTQRQYGLRQRAVTLGWPKERVIVIDSDLGLAGALLVRRSAVPAADQGVRPISRTVSATSRTSSLRRRPCSMARWKK